MKKTPLLILFAAVFLIQIAFPLKTILSQYAVKKYGEESLEPVKLSLGACFYNYTEHWVHLEGGRKIFLKKDAVKILKNSKFNSKSCDAQIKLKKLKGRQSVEDLIVEGIALKNSSAEDLKLLEEKLSAK